MSIVNQLNRILHALMSHFWIVSTNMLQSFVIRKFFSYIYLDSEFSFS